MAENKKVLLSLRGVEVKFKVRSRILTAIRGVDLDIYENESIAIVGESGSGKSVLTKTFSGMLDSNGFVSKGSIIYADDELSDTTVKNSAFTRFRLKLFTKLLNNNYKKELGGKERYEAFKLKVERKAKFELPEAELDAYQKQLKNYNDDIIDKRNYQQTIDTKKDGKEEFKKVGQEIKQLVAERDSFIKTHNKRIAEIKSNVKQDKEGTKAYKEAVRKYYADAKAKGVNAVIPQEVLDRNERIAKEIVLSIGRYPLFKEVSLGTRLVYNLNHQAAYGTDLNNVELLNSIFDKIAFRVEYRETLENGDIKGYALLDLAKVKYTGDWQQIRGRRIATIFQDPMTSLNPIIPIGKQIMTVILKHQKCSEAEALEKTVEIMEAVGIHDARHRVKDYPFQYSGGMRQRIVIAIALSCQPKILICDEPTTALDVTIQAQILDLIKELQRKYNYTTVYITHDLGVVANVAERVAVLYAGQIVELGLVEEIFYDPKHPYTWALLSSLPQLAVKGTELFSINGTPPSLYNKIVGDPFAPRNQYCMAIDLVEDAPYFEVSPTHRAKTWLLDPRAPKVEKPEIIKDIYNKMKASFLSMGSTNITEEVKEDSTNG